MSDEQIEQAIEAIQGMLAARAAGDNAKVIEGVAGEVGEGPAPRKSVKSKRRDASALPDATSVG